METIENEVTTVETPSPRGKALLNPFADVASFELAQRMVKPLAGSDLVPKQFQNSTGNCLIALNMANRMGADPFAVMQSVYIVHGKPSFSSSFLIGLINHSGIIKGRLSFEMFGNEGSDGYGCRAIGTDPNGEALVGPDVTIAMAKSEGWYSRNGSKWPNMAGIMLRYRAASFWAKFYAPELTLGIRSVEENVDIGDGETFDSGIVELNEALAEKDITPAPAPEAKPEKKAEPKQKAEQWPGKINEDGVDVWIDSTGESYDPDKHAWSDDHDAPSVTKAGKFRKKRKGASSPVVKAGVNENPPHKSPLPGPSEPETEAGAEVDAPGQDSPAASVPPSEEPAPEPAEYKPSPTVKAMVMNIEQAETPAQVESMLAHPLINSMDPAAVEYVRAAADKRFEELKQTDNTVE